tara:strand:- start:269 stop:505 length:237 start_codon:yes stop_codon:yes gene_type:complete
MKRAFMAFDGKQTNADCLSLADGFLDECPLVRRHNAEIGAETDDVVEVPQELKGEFTKLSSSLKLLSRAFELGLVNDQ